MAKNTHWFITFLLAVFAVYMLYSLHKTQLQLHEIKNIQPKEINTSANNKEIEVVHYMQRIQLFHVKLFFAGKEKNHDLVKFYLHEIEEEMETIEEARIIDNNINISRLMKQIGLKALEILEDKYKDQPEDFDNLFTNFTMACNTCHSAAGYPEIKIKVPEFNPFSNQEFKSR